MITPVIIILLIIILWLVLGCGAAIWFAFRLRQSGQGKTSSRKSTMEPVSFRWSYIILPAAILLLSIILAAFFYQQLPDSVAYHFQLDGSPDRWLSREIITAGTLAPQLIFTLLAGAITLGVIKLGILSKQTGAAGIKPERILLLMGNMIALPQIVLCFAMLDIFSYNSYQVHVMPLWVFALIIMGLGAIILGGFFILTIRRVWRATQRYNSTKV